MCPNAHNGPVPVTPAGTNGAGGTRRSRAYVAEALINHAECHYGVSVEDDEGDRFSDAIRLLLLIAAVSDPLNEAEQLVAPKHAVAVLRAEGRLQKLDFWLRNPDYLADELLNDYERQGEAINLELAGGILDSDEPEICAIPMLRYLFGAFEYIDQAMSILAAPGLVAVVPRRTARADLPPWRARIRLCRGCPSPGGGGARKPGMPTRRRRRRAESDWQPIARAVVVRPRAMRRCRPGPYRRPSRPHCRACAAPQGQCGRQE